MKEVTCNDNPEPLTLLQKGHCASQHMVNCSSFLHVWYLLSSYLILSNDIISNSAEVFSSFLLSTRPAPT